VQTTLEDVFERHALSVCRYFRRATGSPEVADDLTQEVFLRLLRGFCRYPSPEREAAWVFRVARNVLVGYWQEPRLTETSLSDLDTDPISSSDPSRVVALGFYEALGTLSKGNREMFLLHAASGLTYVEIAETVGMTEEAVRSRLYRLRRHLKRLLSSRPSSDRFTKR
jgi:RNA polymerase sigma-70 factor (ECF subfamily)